MCDYEEFSFDCGHSFFRLKCYCHYARNHPQHYCHFVKKLRNVWDQLRPCEDCERKTNEARAAFYQQHGQGSGGGSQH
ncbi:hypothetical protein VTK26DRAFT_6036 [Humicola hyalothermophila]